MTWSFIQSPEGEYQLIEHGTPVPGGWAVVAATTNPPNNPFIDY